MWRTKLLVIGLLIGLGANASAQTVIQQNLNGTDSLNIAAGGPGGTGYPTTVQAMRNAVGHTLIAAGTTVNTSASNAAAVLIAQGAITTWNISLPNNPYTGENLEVTCPGGTASTVSVGVGPQPAGQLIVGTAYTGCTSGGAATNNARWTYSTSVKTWYRIE